MPVSQSVESPAQIQWATKEQLSGLVRRSVRNTDVVLDVGPGIIPQSLIWPKLHICVEVHDEYVDYLSKGLGSPRYLVMHSAWDEALRVMAAKSVDTVVALDFIEHLDKADGMAFISEAERVARQQVVIYTPLGFFPQEYQNDSDEDRWGMHGAHWQTHRSGWLPSDFSADWEIIACKEYHTVDQHGPLAEPMGCMWAIQTLGGPTAKGSLESRLRRRTLVNRYVPDWFRPTLLSLRRLFPAREK